MIALPELSRTISGSHTPRTGSTRVGIPTANGVEIAWAACGVVTNAASAASGSVNAATLRLTLLRMCRLSLPRGASALHPDDQTLQAAQTLRFRPRRWVAPAAAWHPAGP